MTAAILLSLCTGASTLVAGRIDAVASTMLPPGTTDGGPRGGQRAADRLTERQVRGAIRADPFLVRAAPRVRVTSRDGVVRLVGRVRTAKERSSIVFKAGQSARVGRIDDRLTIGDATERATR